MGKNFSEQKTNGWWLDLFFRLAIFLKGLDGLFEIVGGVFISFITNDQINKIINLLVSGELREDPTDLIANYLIKAAASFSLNAQIFLSIYLLLHGVLKVFLVISLWRDRLWAYPAAIVIFTLFTIYQFYLLALGLSFGLLFLTILDIAVVILTWLEYRRLKSIRSLSTALSE